MAEIEVVLPGEDVLRLPGGKTGAELVGRLPKDIVAFLAEGEILDFTRPLPEEGRVEALPIGSPQGLMVLRHSAAHVMAAALARLYPGVKFWKGPALEDERYGFYYDVDLEEKSLGPEDLPRIEKEMARIVKENQPFERVAISREEALEKFKAQGDVYKLALLEQIPPGEEITLYRNGDFEDLCRGPHLPRTGLLGRGFALLTTAGAYFQGDERNKMLTRVYGHAFPTREELLAHKKRLEEVARRDHRKLGKELDLFSLQPEGGAGLVFWHPKGGRVRHLVERFWVDEHLKRGYEIVYTPHILKQTLWEKSGHYEFYSDLMFSPMEVEGQNYLVKPMNCPGHILIYKNRLWSYRELPLRLAELGTVYRYEKSGVLHGLLRVRGFTQDDAHIFCTPEQLEGEIRGCLELMDYLLKAFGYTYTAYLSTRPEKFIGDPKVWEEVEGILEKSLQDQGISYQVDPGEGAFYAPKIDVKLTDALGRAWQGPTIQVDFNLPERFDLTYRGADGAEHRVFMIHRALLGSMERFIGGLIEHYAGAFPVWLAPVQVRILPVTEARLPYAESCLAALKEAGLRAEVDRSGEKVGKQVRRALFQEKIPYAAVVGEREEQEGTLAVRHRSEGEVGNLTVRDLAALLGEKVKNRS